MSSDFDAEHGALDAYSAIVIRRGAADAAGGGSAHQHGRGESAGSAVVLSDEGHLHHELPRRRQSRGGTAEFADGTVARFEVIGRDPLSDLAVVRTDGDVPRPPVGDADHSLSAPWSWRSAIRSVWPAR